jgi:hypothetical protein
MATRLKEFTPTKGYPWVDWTDGDWWTVTQGDDFDCKIESFPTSLSKKASDMGLSYEAHCNDPKPGQITFRFLNADGTPIAQKRRPKSKPSK